MNMRQKALDYLSRREHSRYELQQKLLRHDFDPAQIEMLLNELSNNNLQSDERFAQEYIHARKQRGYGPDRVIEELRQKGVSDAVIRNTVQPDAPEWHESLVRLLTSRSGVMRKEQSRISFLLNRGYSIDMISKCFAIQESFENE